MCCTNTFATKCSTKLILFIISLLFDFLCVSPSYCARYPIRFELVWANSYMYSLHLFVIYIQVWRLTNDKDIVVRKKPLSLTIHWWPQLWDATAPTCWTTLTRTQKYHQQIYYDHQTLYHFIALNAKYWQFPRLKIWMADF